MFPISRFRRVSLVLFAAVLLGTTGLLAAANGGGATCFNCDNFFGSWECDTGSLWGGSSCTVTADSCSVSGDCNGSGSSYSVAVGHSVILDIAAQHPRAAATLYEVTKTSQVSEKTRVHWFEVPMSVNDVQTLLNGQPLGKNPTQTSVVYEAETIDLEADSIAVTIRPIAASPLDPPFAELSLFLERTSSGSQTYTVFSWDLR